MRSLSTHLKVLFENELYQEILDRLTQLEEPRPSLMEQGQCAYYKSRALERLGQHEDALQVASEAREEVIPAEEKILNLILLIAQLYALNELNRKDEAIKGSEEGDTMLESLTSDDHKANADWISLFYNVKGNIYIHEDFDTALEYYQRSLAIQETIYTLGNVGYVYWRKGEYDRALDYHKRSLTLGEASGNSHYIGYSLNNIGIVHMTIGEAQIALDYFERSLSLYEKLDSHPNVFSDLNNNLAICYRMKGDITKALNYIKQSLKIREKAGNDRDVGESLLNLFIIALEDQHDHGQAQKYLEKLQVVRDRTSDQEVHLYFKYATALILKQSPRMKDKVQAQSHLRKIVEEYVEFKWFTISAIYHLCELLLLEAKLFEGQEALGEAKMLL